MTDIDASQVLRRLAGVFHTSSKRRSESSEHYENESPSVTNFLFRVHTKLTSTILMGLSVLVFIQQLLNVHMSCLTEEESRPSAIVQYCFITGTYTVPSLYSQSHLTPHLGVGNFIKSSKNEQKFHHYFQWVPFVLGLQGAAFILPGLLWKSVELGRLRLYASFKIGSRIPPTEKFSSDLQRSAVYQANPPTKKFSSDLQRSAVYFAKSQGFNKNYGFTFAFCEVLNLVVVLMTFWTTDWFLSGSFRSLGSDWAKFLHESKGTAQDSLINPVDKVFPKVTKCEFQKFGPSGSIIKYDILCILRLNIINEKIYLILWFWLVGLFLVDILGMFYRSLLITSRSFRSFVILRGLGFTRNNKNRDRKGVKSILARVGYCDWFLLKRISDSMDGELFSKFCQTVCNWMEEGEEGSHEEEQLLRFRKLLGNYEIGENQQHQNYQNDQKQRHQHLPGPGEIRFGGFGGSTLDFGEPENGTWVNRSKQREKGSIKSTTTRVDIENDGGDTNTDTLTRKRLQSDPLPEPEHLQHSSTHVGMGEQLPMDVDTVDGGAGGHNQNDGRMSRSSEIRQGGGGIGIGIAHLVGGKLGKSQQNIYI